MTTIDFRTDPVTARRHRVVSLVTHADIHLFRLFWRYVDTLHPRPGAVPRPRRALSVYAHTPGGKEDVGGRERDRLPLAAVRRPDLRGLARTRNPCVIVAAGGFDEVL